MFEFFRKYQRYFFFVISIVIIVSFSFFGTYSTLSPDPLRDQIAFTAIDGTPVKRSEVEELAIFLSTDNQDKLLFGGMWGPNFLNDGVIAKDFLQTGLAQILLNTYAQDVAEDLSARLQKEKHNTLYSHPEAPFINIEGAWNYFVPGMKSDYDRLRQSDLATASNAIDARVRLYLGERQFPAPMIKQVLRYQERQYGWLQPDPSLDRADLSLFGYHTLQDWFGQGFIRLVSQFIINSAKVAESNGYSVSKEEVLADLMRNTAISFQQNINNPALGVANETEYFNEQLRRLGMDQTLAVKIWTQVMLFRRLFEGVGNSVIVDAKSMRDFQSYAQEQVVGDLYRLPKDLQFSRFRDLQLFEAYLNAVSKKSGDALTPPATFLSVDQVKKNNPELVQKRYLIDMAQINKDALQAKISLKETWNWEVEDAHWNLLKKQFPELGLKKGDTRDDRFAALESLDDKIRARVDAYARSAIVDEHSDWIVDALDEEKPRRMTVGLRAKGGSFPFAGIQDREGTMKLLDQASLEGQPLNEAAKTLQQLKGELQTVYRITVVARDEQSSILTFGEAKQEGLLEPILDKELEAYYQNNRASHADKFQKGTQDWKPFAEVKDQVGELYFSKLMQSIQDAYKKGVGPEKAPSVFLNDFTASLRFYPYVRSIKEKVVKDPAQATRYVSEAMELNGSSLAPRQPLDAQWKLELVSYEVDRRAGLDMLAKEDVFKLAPGDWTPVYHSANGDDFFFHLKEKKQRVDDNSSTQQLAVLDRALAEESERRYMGKLVAEMAQKQALSLEYLKHNTRTEVENESE